MGLIYRDTGQTEKALQHLEQAFEIAQEIGNKRGQANVLGNMGNIYRATGQTEKALQHLQQAFEIDKEIGNKLGQAQDLGASTCLKLFDFCRRNLRPGCGIG